MKTLLFTILRSVLRSLARATLWRYKPTVIGVTGNVGKTSTKLVIETVLRHKKRVRASSRSFNNELGLPLTILGSWKMTGGVLFWLRVIFFSFFRLMMKRSSYPEILVLEYGVDKPGDMQYLLSIVRPHIGVVTAIGDVPVHVEFFAGKEAIVKEKAKMIQQLPATGFALLNTDDAVVHSMREQTRAHVVTFGFAEQADMHITNFATSFENKIAAVTFKLHYGGSFIPVRIEGVLGRPQGYAAAVAAAIGLIFGMNLVNIAEALDDYHAPPGRLRVLRGVKETTIIDDTYNASPLAMEGALAALKGVRAKRKIAVLGDMLEIGKYAMDAHESLGRAAAKSAHMLITVGRLGKFIAEGAKKAGMPKKNVVAFDNIREAGLFLQGRLEKGDIVLIKGSQAVRMEKVVKEVMAEPNRAEQLLVRQDKRWLEKKGSYE